MYLLYIIIVLVVFNFINFRVFLSESNKYKSQLFIFRGIFSSNLNLSVNRTSLIRAMFDRKIIIYL